MPGGHGGARIGKVPRSTVAGSVLLGAGVLQQCPLRVLPGESGNQAGRFLLRHRPG